MPIRAARKDGRGSRPGERRGGRKKGSRNKRTRIIAEQARAEGITPLEYVLRIMRDEKADPRERFQAAVSALPYVHPRLAAIEHGGSVDIGYGAELEAATKRLEEAEANGKDPALGHPPP
jgi:hypothetical protein